MANNRMYIECTGCEEADLYYLAKRMMDGYYAALHPKDISEWFDKHRHCGGTHDHFRIVLQHPANYDMAGVLAIIEEKLRGPQV